MDFNEIYHQLLKTLKTNKSFNSLQIPKEKIVSFNIILNLILLIEKYNLILDPYEIDLYSKICYKINSNSCYKTPEFDIFILTLQQPENFINILYELCKGSIEKAAIFENYRKVLNNYITPLNINLEPNCLFGFFLYIQECCHKLKKL